MAEINGEQQNVNVNQLIPPETHNLNYYQEYCRLFIANVILTTQMKELMTEKASLHEQISNLDKRLVELSQRDGSDDDKKRRIRRSAKSIDRHYKCPVASCQKQYGSEGSLNQHMKLKHPDVYAQTVKAEESSEFRNEQNEQNEENEEQSEMGQTNNNSN